MTRIVGLNELNHLFTLGHFKDYSLVEYDLLQHFFQQTKPKSICVVGGGTNIDLFYACQGQKIDAINFDRRPDSWTLQTEDFTKERHKEFKKYFSFEGDYRWVNRYVNNINQVEEHEDFVWLNAHLPMMHEMTQTNTIPNSLIVTHYGNYRHAESIYHMGHYIPLVAMSKRIAFFTKLPFEMDYRRFVCDTTNYFEHKNVNMVET